MIEASMISKAFESGMDNLKKSFDLPNFFKHDGRLEQINNFKDADKPLYTENLKESDGLSNEQKEILKEETGWSNEIIDSIKTWDEAEIYLDAGLKEVEIDGKKCLIKNDIDMNQKDSMGRNNKERMEQGLAPLDKNGKPIELHHIGQRADSPLAELTMEEHRGKGNDSILHDKTKESEIDRNKFNREKAEHWKSRAQMEDSK